MEDITTTPPLAGMLTCSLSWGIVINLNQHQIAHHRYENKKNPSYDEQSQMWESKDCVAKPNSPLRKTFHGVSTQQSTVIIFTALKILGRKIIFHC